MLMARADWRDDYAYAADGSPSAGPGPAATAEEFTADGDRILTPAADGAPLTVSRSSIRSAAPTAGRPFEEISAALP